MEGELGGEPIGKETQRSDDRVSCKDLHSELSSVKQQDSLTEVLISSQY